MSKYDCERYKNVPENEKQKLSIETIILKCGKTLHNIYQAL